MAEIPKFSSLKEIILQIGKEREWRLLGSEEHFKFEPGYCRVDYDEWDMGKVCGEGIDFVLSYWDNITAFSIRKSGSGHDFFHYTVRRAYLEEQVEFLKKIDSGLARILADVKESDWMQGDTKNTEVNYSMSWSDYSDVYAFLKQYIQLRFEEF